MLQIEGKGHIFCLWSVLRRPTGKQCAQKINNLSKGYLAKIQRNLLSRTTEEIKKKIRAGIVLTSQHWTIKCTIKLRKPNLFWGNPDVEKFKVTKKIERIYQTKKIK